MEVNPAAWGRRNAEAQSSVRRPHLAPTGRSSSPSCAPGAQILPRPLPPELRPSPAGAGQAEKSAHPWDVAKALLPSPRSAAWLGGQITSHTAWLGSPPPNPASLRQRPW